MGEKEGEDPLTDIPLSILKPKNKRKTKRLVTLKDFPQEWLVQKVESVEVVKE